MVDTLPPPLGEGRVGAPPLHATRPRANRILASSRFIISPFAEITQALPPVTERIVSLPDRGTAAARVCCASTLTATPSVGESGAVPVISTDVGPVIAQLVGLMRTELTGRLRQGAGPVRAPEAAEPGSDAQ